MNIDLKSKESIYLLGYFWADCYFSTKNNRRIFSFEIKTEDFLNIWPLIKSLGFDKYISRIRKNSKNSQSSVTTSKYDQLEMLEKLNFHKRIEGCYFYQNISDELKPFFIKGFLDGDGSISLDKNNSFRVCFYGPKEQNWNFLISFCNDFDIKYVIYKKERMQHHASHKQKIHSYSVFEFTNIGNRLKFCESLKITSDIGLSRKWNIYEQYRLRRQEKQIQKINRKRPASRIAA